MDLLTAYTHDSELSLISTLYKPLQHTLSLFPAYLSSAIPWQRLLTVEILQLNALSYIFTASCAELSLD
jgi:hypothetical protein